MPPKTDWTFSEFDWAEYVRFRPPYTPAMYKLLYDYHARNSDSWVSAYDIGAGGGIVSAELLNRFEHVTVSDPSSEYTEKARKMLGDAPASRLSYANHRGEEPLAAPQGSVDLASIAMAIHWMDPEAVVRNILPFLRPGGTLAIWSYATRFVLEDVAPEVQAAWFDVYALWQRVAMGHITSSRAVSIMGSRMDCIPFDSKSWRDVHRHHWISEHRLLDTDLTVLPSRVEPGETVVQRPERDWFAVEGDLAWIKGYVTSLHAEVEQDAIFDSDEWRRFTELFGDADVKRKITWPSIMLLATKR